MSVAVVIVAAGRGSRAGGEVPKQWQQIAGRMVADWTVRAFTSHPKIDHIVFVHHADDTDKAKTLLSFPRCDLVIGGATRSLSALAGLKALEHYSPARVLIHDVARPCVSHTEIDYVLSALENGPAAALALPVTDALWVGKNDTVKQIKSREGLFRAQTPQGFDYKKILRAHLTHDGDAADDVEIARKAGLSIQMVDGHENNLKITQPHDFIRAANILRGPMDVRLGNGFDVHKFGSGDAVVLCGITVPHTNGLVGHSDADVGMHAVTDAIYGALAMGDIGRHFPPSDPQWKGVSSDIFLRHATDMAVQQGFSISNIDCTLICEFPKIGPHANQMQTAMSKIMGIELGRVSVKATTSEKLGFTGRGEGIAAIATAALVRL